MSPAGLFKAKLAPPKQLVAMYPRERLTACLSAGKARKVTLIEAPAGFGKTTLLAQWRELLLAQPVRVAWLTLDEDDTAERLIGYLALALADCGADLHGTGLLSEDRRGLPSATSALHAIIDALMHDAREIVLILDDFERLRSRDAQHQVEALMQYAPDNLHIAIAGRSNPGVSIAHLSLMGVVNHVDAGSLRFTSSEAAAYLRQCAPEAAANSADIDRADGWPVALQIVRFMVGRAQQGMPQPPVAGIAASYFTEQLVKLLQPHQRTFLCDVSLLEAVNIALADHVREARDAQSILCELDHLSPLIPPLEGAAGQFRLHPMLREHFAGLALADPARCTKLHRRAAEWFTTEKDLSAALRHAVAAGDKMLTGRLIVQSGGVSIWIKHGMAEVVAANELIDEEMIAAMPRLGLMRAIVLIKQSRLHEARAQYERVAASTTDFSVDPSSADASTLAREGLFILSMLVIYCCLPLSEAHLRSLDQGLHDPAADEVELAHHKTVLCVTYLQSGHFEAAGRYGEEAAAHCRAFGSIYGTNFVDFHMGSIAMARGDREQARQRYEKGRRKARRHFAHDVGLRLVGDVLTAELDLERNAIAHVKGRLARVVERLHDAEAWYEIYAAAYGTASELLLIEQGVNEALSFLEHAQERAEHLRLSKLLPLIDAFRVAVLTLSGDTEGALRAAQRSSTPFADAAHAAAGAAWREVEALSTAWARLMLRCGQYEDARKTIDQALTFAGSRGAARMELRLNVLGALTSDALGEHEMTVARVEAICAQIARTGYVRAVQREGAPLESLLRRIGNRLPAGPQRALELAALFGGDGRSTERRITLSPRELDVLRHLDQGMQDKVIARRLGVTEHAVRFHLKNIFAKTKARGRLEALARARQMGVLDAQPS